MGANWNQRRTGYVADYCLICRDVTACALTKLEREGQTQFSCCCNQCGVWFETDLTTFKQFEAEPMAVMELMRRTAPLLPRVVIGRASYDNAAIRGLLTPDNRSRAVREPFQHLRYLWSQPWSVPSWAVAVIVAMFPVVCACISMQSHQYDILRRTGVNVVLFQFLVIVPLISAAVWLGRWHDRIRSRRRVDVPLAMIARSLRALRPTLDELRSEMEPLRQTESIPAWMTADMVFKAVSGRADTSFSNIAYRELEAMSDRLYQEQQELFRKFEEGGSEGASDSLVA